MTAILQTPLTVKNAARLMNVAERSVIMAKAVWRLLPDLGREFTADRMSVAEAHLIARGKAKATSWDQLFTAWRNAGDDERDRLVFAILKAEREGAQ